MNMSSKFSVRDLLNSRSPSPGHSYTTMTSSSSSGAPPNGSKHHRFAANLFGLTDRGSSSPAAATSGTTPRNVQQFTYEPTTPNNYPSSAMMTNQTSRSSLSPPHPYEASYNGSATSPLSSLHDESKISSHTTPSYDIDIPFDIGGDSTMNDFGIDLTDDFASPPPIENPTYPFDAVKRTESSSSKATHLPSPDSTNAGSPPVVAARKLGSPLNFTTPALPQAYQSMDTVTSPTFNVEDHDEEEERRTRKRTGPGEARLNKVANAPDSTDPRPRMQRGDLPGEDVEIPSLQDMAKSAEDKERILLVEGWLSRSQTSTETVLGESGRLTNRERLGVNADSSHKRSRSVGDWRKVGPMHASSQEPAEALPSQNDLVFALHDQEAHEFPFEDFSPRASGDVLHDETSEEEESEDGSEDHSSSDLGGAVMPDDEYAFLPSDIPAVDDSEFAETNIDPLQEEATDDFEDVSSASQYPSTHGFYNGNEKLWTDPPRVTNHYDMTHNVSRAQPPTANAAIERLRLAADKFDAASRVATFGSIATRGRRLSAGDIDGLPGIFHRMSFGQEKETLSVPQKSKAGDHERKASMFEEKKNEVKNVLKRFASAGSEHARPVFGSSSGLGSHGGSFTSSSSAATVKDNGGVPGRKESQKSSGSSAAPTRKFPSLHRKLSKGKRKKDELKLDTKSAWAGMMGPLMSVGGGEGGASAASTIGTSTTVASPSRSQRYGSQGSSRLGSVDVKFGQPSIPAPRHSSQGTLNVPQPNIDASSDDEGSDVDAPGDTVMTPPPPPPQPPKLVIEPVTVPNRSGFNKNCTQMFPRLGPKLTDRIALEQVKKFRRLQDNYMKHEALVRQHGHCGNKEQCAAVTGQMRETSKMVFSVGAGTLPHVANHLDEQYGGEDSDDDLGENFTNGDGKVSAAQFPYGVPVPPTARLPAEFECPICFKMKKFTKPSDWTKHVHEDVMPFTCTFPECTEPKSFKRKADWVRHENEKHRHLEWWRCNFPDCPHICYRKDNFVQHLVREHKQPEVKVKAGKGGPKPSTTKSKKTSGARRSSLDDPSEDNVNRVWDIVNACHKETDKEGKDEPCRFCHECQPTWKKLTVHIARHMERISLPVLTLVGENAVMSPLSAKTRNNSTKTSPIGGPFSAGGYGIITPIGNMTISEALYNHSATISPVNSGGMMLPSQITMGPNGDVYYQSVDMTQTSLYHNGGPASEINTLHYQFPPSVMMTHTQHNAPYSSLSHGADLSLEQQAIAEAHDYELFMAQAQAAQLQQHHPAHDQYNMGNSFDAMQLSTEQHYPAVDPNMTWSQLQPQDDDNKYIDYNAVHHPQQHQQHQQNPY